MNNLSNSTRSRKEYIIKLISKKFACLLRSTRDDFVAILKYIFYVNKFVMKSYYRTRHSHYLNILEYFGPKIFRYVKKPHWA